ncbi:transglutaminase domain-containing protein [Spirosoma agri]|uniref:Kyphoscoliosis peptidase n=1 Tax=Spirosoma agri TaxID=1987381 RepID=A0A6M0INK9_9BACT|nr:transglutaminase domain-containing protein [Spirosoma agri]NEU69896.1 Kyphoscoliosis peptidase [Spirosoma agri]
MQNYTIRSRRFATGMALFLLFFSTALTVPSQPGPGIPRPSKFVAIDYSTIDRYAQNAPESAAKNLNTLSDYLTSPAKTELAKARSVYAWITSHVRYDESTFSGRKYSSEVEYANRVLRDRKGVCTGFSLLFKHLLGRTGIPVVTIKGYSRTNDSEAGQPIQRVDHEWNAVNLDGEWYLLDIAWAQTTAKPGPDGELRPNDFFFLTEPAAFAANHFPTDPRWQLLNPTVSKTQFDQFPKVYDAYFRLGFDPDFPKTGLIRTNDVLTVSLQNDSEVEFLCSMGRQGGSTATDLPVTIRRSGSTYQLSVPVSQRGNSTLYIFAKSKGPRSERVKSYEGIASFTVVKS